MTLGARRFPWLAGLAVAAVVIGFLNFLWFLAESSSIGDANRAYVWDGHYYFVNAGRTTEVSQQTYEWSAFHGASVFVTHPLALVGGAYLLFTIAFPSMVGASRKPEDREPVDRIRASGDVLARTRTGGRIGELSMTRPLIGVEVLPGGVLLSPLGLEPIGIEAGAIVAVAPETSLLRGSGVAISHHQAGVPRIGLLINENDPVVTALRSVALGQPDPGGGDPLPQPAARSTEPYSLAMKAMILGGFVLAIPFAAVIIPLDLRPGSFGPFGVAFLVAILGFNAWTFFVHNRDRW